MYVPCGDCALFLPSLPSALGSERAFSIGEIEVLDRQPRHDSYCYPKLALCQCALRTAGRTPSAWMLPIGQIRDELRRTRVLMIAKSSIRGHVSLKLVISSESQSHLRLQKAAQLVPSGWGTRITEALSVRICPHSRSWYAPV